MLIGVEAMSLTEIPMLKTRTFLSVNIDMVLIKSKLKLSPQAAFILSLLLREYQAHITEFDSTAYRQHVHTIRKLLYKRFGDRVIVSMGMGMYAIPDDIKLAIQKYIYS
jgi:hypothetical protein